MLIVMFLKKAGFHHAGHPAKCRQNTNMSDNPLIICKKLALNQMDMLIRLFCRLTATLQTGHIRNGFEYMD